MGLGRLRVGGSVSAWPGQQPRVCALRVWGSADLDAPSRGAKPGRSPGVATRSRAPLQLLGRAVIPDPDTLGDWLRRMGDPQTGQAGLVGLGRGRDALTARLLRRDAHATYTLAADATFVGGEKRDAHWSDTGEPG